MALLRRGLRWTLLKIMVALSSVAELLEQDTGTLLGSSDSRSVEGNDRSGGSEEDLSTYSGDDPIGGRRCQQEHGIIIEYLTKYGPVDLLFLDPARSPAEMRYGSLGVGRNDDDRKSFTELLEALKGPSALLIVGEGEDEARIHVPIQLLIRRSRYFRAALEGAFLESRSKVLTFPDEKADVVEMTIQWMVTGQIRLQKRHLPFSEDFYELNADFPQQLDAHDFRCKIIPLTRLIVFLDKLNLVEAMKKATDLAASLLAETQDLIYFELRVMPGMVHWFLHNSLNTSPFRRELVKQMKVRLDWARIHDGETEVKLCRRYRDAIMENDEFAPYRPVAATGEAPEEDAKWRIY